MADKIANLIKSDQTRDSHKLNPNPPNILKQTNQMLWNR